jgi:nucleotide-binding universal stress UspA family protein
MQEETNTNNSTNNNWGCEIKRIAIAMDASPLSKIATKEAVQLAARLNAEISAICIEDANIKKMASHAYVKTVSPFVAASQTFDEEAVKNITRLQISKSKSHLEQEISGLKIPYTFEVKTGNVKDEILNVAKDADLLVLGWAGWQTTNLYGTSYVKDPSSFKTIRLGETTKKIINCTNTSTLIVRGEFGKDLPIITAFDGSECSEKSLQIATTIFKASRDRRKGQRENRRRKEEQRRPNEEEKKSLLKKIKSKTKSIASNIRDYNRRENYHEDEITVFLLIDEVNNTIKLENQANEILEKLGCRAHFIPLPPVDSAEKFRKIFIPPLHLLTGGVFVLSSEAHLYGNAKPIDMPNELLNSIPCSLLLVK